MKLLQSIIRKYSKIDDNLLVFTSFYGKYADSPKILSEAIHRKNPEKRIAWLINDTSNPDIPAYVEKIKYGSVMADKFYGKAKAIIDNVYCGHEYYTRGNSLSSRIKFKIGTFLKNKKGQYYYTTWHGNMIKKIGSDSVRNNSFNFSCSNTTMFLDNVFSKKIMERITKGTIKIRVMGEPRDDILFSKNINKKVLKRKLGLPVDKKAIIYAPTFRSNDDETRNIENSGIRQLRELDIDKLLNLLAKKFGGDWIFVVRFHYHVEEAVDWSALNKKYNGRVINGNESEDIIDYIACCDALISDVSSCIFESSFANNPTFAFFPDYDHFANNERGFYYTKDELPWTVSMNADELYKNIRQYDQKRYEKKFDSFCNKSGFTARKPCADLIADYILKELSQ